MADPEQPPPEGEWDPASGLEITPAQKRWAQAQVRLGLQRTADLGPARLREEPKPPPAPPPEPVVEYDLGED